MRDKRGIIHNLISETGLNPNIGTWSYLLHRITGIGLAVYLLMHTWVLSSAQSGPAAFNSRMESVQTPFFHFLELFLSVAVFWHLLNGIRITLADFFSWTRIHKPLFWIVVVLFVAVMSWNVVAVWPKLLGH
jgi:succinate dehydrogenase / fumarate reductase, cytochrome b subunit